MGKRSFALMTIMTASILKQDSIPVTCFTGFLGEATPSSGRRMLTIQGKTSTILGLLTQLPEDYKVVLLKNEFGDVEVDSKLASQSQIANVSEILNGCMCCTMVGLVENALIEIKETMKPDRIIIESSGSAFPATLALQIRSLEPKGFHLDGVVTVIDAVNFRGYEDSSPSAKIQAKYTDLLIINKHQLLSEREYDDMLDHLLTLNDETPYIRVGPSPENPLKPELVFGLDTKLFLKDGDERGDWEALAGSGAKGHIDEVETKSVWRGGAKPGSSKAQGKKRAHGHEHEQGVACDGCAPGAEDDAEVVDEIIPLDRELLKAELDKLPFEIYRVKGYLRLSESSRVRLWSTYIINWAFGRHELTPFPSLDDAPELSGVTLRLTVMGEQGEVARRARRLAQALEGQMA